MKKYIIGFILGIIISSGVVFAVTQINANDIRYDENNSVKDKIDDLYTKTTTWKNLTTATTVSQSNLLSGVTAYDNLGNLITGNISTNCVSGTWIPSNSVKTSNGDIIENVLEPTVFVLRRITGSNHIIVYVQSKDGTTNYYQNGSIQNNFSSVFTISNNSLVAKNWNGRNGETYVYIACN